MNVCVVFSLALLAQNPVEYQEFDPATQLPFSSVRVLTNPGSNLIVIQRSSTNVANPSERDLKRLESLRSGAIFEPGRLKHRIGNPDFVFHAMIAQDSAKARSRLSNKKDVLKRRAEIRRAKAGQ